MFYIDATELKISAQWVFVLSSCSVVFNYIKQLFAGFVWLPNRNAAETYLK